MISEKEAAKMQKEIQNIENSINNISKMQTSLANKSIKDLSRTEPEKAAEYKVLADKLKNIDISSPNAEKEVHEQLNILLNKCQ